MLNLFFPMPIRIFHRRSMPRNLDLSEAAVIRRWPLFLKHEMTG